ncbi:type II toxin-antitoxin system VapC family toxin [Achromobacter anxifer]
MKKKRRILLDTNIWSYVAELNMGDALSRAARIASAEILAAPTVVQELKQISNVGKRRAALTLVTRLDWKRLMPEAYSECMELKAEIRRLRPHWCILNPSLIEVHRLRYDWIKKSGGFWERARNDVPDRITDESIRAEKELELARSEATAIREKVKHSNQNVGAIHLQEVAHIPFDKLGWNGTPVDYWRAPSLYSFSAELMIYASPYREWLDNEVDVMAMLADRRSMNRLWFHELDARNVPRQWMRGAFELLMAWHKITPGSPGDCSLATYLPDADVVVSADKNLVNFANRCYTDAPFKTAEAVKARGGEGAIQDLLEFIMKGA